MRDIFLGRQPIVDRNRDRVAFELLFRSGLSGGADFTDDTLASLSVAINTFGEMGLQQVLGGRSGFINVGSAFLMSKLMHLLPAGQVVIELLETIEFDDRVVARCRELKSRGFRLALDDVCGERKGLEPILPLVDIVKIDLMATDAQVLPDLVKSLRSRRVTLVAEKVETESQARLCMRLGFDLFQGYFFARPEILAGKRSEASRLPLLRMLKLVLGAAGLGTGIEAQALGALFPAFHQFIAENNGIGAARAVSGSVA